MFIFLLSCLHINGALDICIMDFFLFLLPVWVWVLVYGRGPLSRVILNPPFSDVQRDFAGDATLTDDTGDLGWRANLFGRQESLRLAQCNLQCHVQPISSL